MKRDCGKGELIPIKFVIVSCVGQSDDEKEQEFNTLDFALSAYRAQVSILKDIKCSDVRLYIKDKQGYMNCIKSWILCKDGKINETDRTSEL